MNVILQGVQMERATAERLAALVQASHIEAVGEHAFRCTGLAADALQHKQELEAQCLAAQVDCTFMAGERRLSDFRLLAMDMDSTLITIECIDEIADMQGLKPQVSAITEAAMRGEIEFSESLQRRVGLLAGLDVSALDRVLERVKLSPGAATMLAAVQAAGLKTLLVSGGFTFFAERLQADLGLDYAHANQLEMIDGKLTGKVLGVIVDAQEKRRKVEAVCAELGIATSQTIVMGDGANDLEMMRIAGLSVAFRAKPVVRAQANVALNFVGLDGVLNVLR
ncbi:phosphoserine phosphatase SerB [Herbaspirillum sp. RTI4]|uniref:phosphoserine phosphatase SerB n=1 Tax=Herbaspirillum sp. RTI4 TaxID=3048640 RepID=UPI002AB48535|nr:phosphoserine phosphatase SerB [Herbaspirillum sp. RTI4]MDY7578551.1 phosphoserine phosphatase SerB [Herbaspirillum sp. RTI4]MEA9981143.1 phosphoserine phosphatase SerB [Herbaspirillum sp. RTI4]